MAGVYGWVQWLSAVAAVAQDVEQLSTIWKLAVWLPAPAVWHVCQMSSAQYTWARCGTQICWARMNGYRSWWAGGALHGSFITWPLALQDFAAGLPYAIKGGMQHWNTSKWIVIIWTFSTAVWKCALLRATKTVGAWDVGQDRHTTKQSSQKPEHPAVLKPQKVMCSFSSHSSFFFPSMTLWQLQLFISVIQSKLRRHVLYSISVLPSVFHFLKLFWLT